MNKQWQSIQLFELKYYIYRNALCVSKFLCSYCYLLPILFHLVLVACTRLYKSLCQLVCLSVSPWVHLLVPLYFLGVFEQFNGKKIRPTVRLTDTVSCRVVCMRLEAIGLVIYPIHSFENVVGADMPQCFSLSGANTKPDLIESYVL